MKKRATLKDIAAATGLSINSVSLAIRNSDRIPLETRLRVKDAAEKLDYIPNLLARGLVDRKTKLVGIVFSDLSNPLLMRLASSLQHQLLLKGYHSLIAVNNNDVYEEIELIGQLLGRQVDGILIYPADRNRVDHLMNLQAKKFPIVTLTLNTKRKINQIGVNQLVGGYKAAMHLINNGHKKIGFIEHSPQLGNGDKKIGYLNALKEAQLDIRPSWQVRVDNNRIEQGYWATKKIFERADKPTAIIGSSDSIAIGTLKYCMERKLSVPNDLAIVGFDNIEFAEHAIVPISTINYDAVEISRHATDRLQELIVSDDQKMPPLIKLLEPALIVRESSDFQIIA